MKKKYNTSLQKYSKMNKRIKNAIVWVLAYAILIFLFLTFVTKNISYVVRVIDGDTFVILTGERVRLIGIDTPEIGEKCYEEAKEYLKNLVEGRIVILTYDKRRYDNYGRLLAYVWLGTTLVNELMIKEGYAVVFTKEDFFYKKKFIDLENHTKVNKIGCLWNK